MRLLVQCSACARQYDASGQHEGQRFHCHCGEVITVQQGRSHEASVVRCSACGGSCQEGMTACPFCNAGLTLHDRDLHTVCPACLARISDRAKFCHHCGTRLAAEQSIGSITEHTCPVCGDEAKLRHRKFDDAANLLECERCAGIWIGRQNFEALTERAKHASAPQLDNVVQPGGTPIPLAEQPGPAYRPCIQCGKLMARQNYGRASGVIVDICRDHGVWFDAHELDAILRWLRAGGAAKELRAKEERLRDRERAQSAATAEARATASMSRVLTKEHDASIGRLLSGFIGLMLK